MNLNWGIAIAALVFGLLIGAESLREMRKAKKAHRKDPDVVFALCVAAALIVIGVVEVSALLA